MATYRRRWVGKFYMVSEDRDGLLGYFREAEDGGWAWQTDLRGMRMEQQLQGKAPTLEAAGEVFKATYERWRSRVSDEKFDRVYRRS